MSAEHKAKMHVVDEEMAAFLLRIPREQKARLERAAAADRRSVTQTLLKLVDDYLAERSDDPRFQPAA